MRSTRRADLVAAPHDRSADRRSRAIVAIVGSQWWSLSSSAIRERRESPHGDEGSALMASPTVTVMIPSYNYAQYLVECVTSALDQPGVNVDVALVDNASTDGSLDLAEQLAASAPPTSASSRTRTTTASSARSTVATPRSGASTRCCCARTTAWYPVPWHGASRSSRRTRVWAWSTGPRSTSRRSKRSSPANSPARLGHPSSTTASVGSTTVAAPARTPSAPRSC